MSNTEPIKARGKTFVLRVDAEFLAALDKVRAQDKPQLSRADMIRRLVFNEEKRLEGKG